MFPLFAGDWCSACAGCGGLIQDQFILRVSPDLSWHAACLKVSSEAERGTGNRIMFAFQCSECHMLLDETHTCFVRDGKTFCKKDYVRCVSMAQSLNI